MHNRARLILFALFFKVPLLAFSNSSADDQWRPRLDYPLRKWRQLRNETVAHFDAAKTRQPVKVFIARSSTMSLEVDFVASCADVVTVWLEGLARHDGQWAHLANQRAYKLTRLCPLY
jgi:hypothetical protein